VRGKSPLWTGNIYGDSKAPSETIRDTEHEHEWKKIIGESKSSSCHTCSGLQRQRESRPKSAEPPSHGGTPVSVIDESVMTSERLY
jgi:hypothetical protein